MYSNCVCQRQPERNENESILYLLHDHKHEVLLDVLSLLLRYFCFILYSFIYILLVIFANSDSLTLYASEAEII